MNDRLPPIFEELTPRPAPGELRERVLAAVDRQLAESASGTNPTRQRGTGPWERAVELLVAASLVLGLGMNVWQWRAEPAWQARVYGAPVVSDAVADLSETLASLTDAQAARSIIERLPQTTPRAADAATFARDYQKLLDELASAKGPLL